ncbi:MAG: NAD-dependent epimerase/dehydratase family protein [Ignavibacteria bacterium]
MPSRILVTGGCGFIGSHLVELLVGKGHVVTVVDDLSTGHRANLAAVTGCDVVEARVEETDLAELGPFDAVFHLAAQASVPLSIDNFFASSATNLLSTIKAVDYCARADIPMVYASSSAVYGNLPLGDESGGIDLLSPYATDKLVAEIYCDMAGKLYGLRSFGLRFFNVYGPRQDPNSPYSGVISIFLKRLLNKQALIINGGYQTRDFIYVGDVVAGMWSALQYLQANSRPSYSNLLTGQSISIDDLATLLMQLTGTEVERVYRELPKGDPEASLGTTARMQEQLRLTDFVALREGLQRTIEWMATAHEGS